MILRSSNDQPKRHGSRLRRLFVRFTLVGVATLLALLVCEMVVRMFVPVRNVGPSFSVYDPTYGKRLKKSFSCARIAPEFRMRFTTNSLGFRGPEPESFPQRSVLFIGDSFTMGYGVSDGQEFPALVRRALASRFAHNRVHVFNAGIGDTGNGRWVRFLREEAPQFDPCYVVFQICGNDFADNVRERMFRLGNNEELIDVSHPRSAGMKRALQRVVEAVPGLPYSRLVSLFRETRIGRFADGPVHEGQTVAASAGTDAPNDRLTYRLAEEIIRICRDHDWPLFVLLVDVEGQRLAEFQTVFRRYEVPWITVPRKDERRDLYYQVDGHWNAAGHEFVAEIIVRHLSADRALWQDEGQTGKQGALSYPDSR